MKWQTMEKKDKATIAFFVVGFLAGIYFRIDLIGSLIIAIIASGLFRYYYVGEESDMPGIPSKEAS